MDHNQQRSLNEAIQRVVGSPINESFIGFLKGVFDIQKRREAAESNLKAEWEANRKKQEKAQGRLAKTPFGEISDILVNNPALIGADVVGFARADTWDDLVALSEEIENIKDGNEVDKKKLHKAINGLVATHKSLLDQYQKTCRSNAKEFAKNIDKVVQLFNKHANDGDAFDLS
jgi:hypothetical protein